MSTIVTFTLEESKKRTVGSKNLSLDNANQQSLFSTQNLAKVSVSYVLR